MLFWILSMIWTSGGRGNKPADGRLTAIERLLPSRSVLIKYEPLFKLKLPRGNEGDRVSLCVRAQHPRNVFHQPNGNAGVLRTDRPWDE